MKVVHAMPVILHLEDDDLDCRLLRARLLQEGVAREIHRVATEAEYRKALNERCYDLILSDYNLPSFDGLAALRVAQETCGDVPFIIVSGAMGETAAVELVKAGATDVVLKDHLERLVPAIRRAIAIVMERRARHAAEEKLRDSETRLRLMFEGVRDYAIFSVDTDGIVVNWNVGAQRLFGYDEPEIVGKDSAMLFTAEDVAAGVPKRERETAASHGKADDERLHQRKDGSRFFASGVVTPIVDEGGVLRGFTKVARDITERMEYEAQLRRARDTAEAASRAKDEFLAVLSHELRTPLTPVLSMAQVLERDASLPPRVHEAVTMIRRNVELEARLIDDLLDLTRVARGKMEFNFVNVDAHDGIRHVLDMCVDEARAKGVELTLNLLPQAIHVRADAARLQQVMWNLLKNAIKFTPAGGRVHVVTDLAGVDDEEPATPDRLRISVRDTGVGFEQALLPRLFDAFEQGGQSVTRQFGGLGLGLTISRAIVEQHGGNIVAHSEGAGRGAAFTVELPVVKREEATPSRRAVASTPAERIDGVQPVQPSADEAPFKILLVEDNLDTIGVMSMVLRMAGFEVRTATSVGEALKAASAERPDLLVSDIGLPDGSGLDLMRQIRNQMPLPGIALSGYGMEEDRRRSRDAGFVAHVTKPIDIATLERVVREVADEIRATKTSSS